MGNSCLILLAHGSPDPRWRAPFQKLAESLAAAVGPGRVRLAYMEFVPPTLVDAIAEAARGGCDRVTVLPLFMAAGGHVDRDIPAQAEAARKRFPGVRVEVLPAAGEHPKVVEALRQVAREALGRD